MSQEEGKEKRKKKKKKEKRRKEKKRKEKGRRERREKERKKERHGYLFLLEDSTTLRAFTSTSSLSESSLSD